MSLLKTLMNEMAAGGATGAGGISTGGGHETVGDYKPNKKKKKIQKEGSLFSGGIVNGEKRNVLKRVMNMETVNAKKSFLESLGVDHGKNDFDASDVLSKIDSAQKQEHMNDDTTAFGLEDDEGNLVKVYVKAEQAEEFENTLASMLAGQVDGEEGDNANAKEIAEVLFELKDKFDIVDVEWPGIETDEEEEQEVTAAPGAGGDPADAAGGAPDAGAEGGDPAAAGGEEDLGLDDGSEGDMEGLGDEDMTADDDAKSALQDVIDVMKSDAEAKKAEANAREAEARAKEAEYTAQGGAAKVKQEEQLFDMEAEEEEEKIRKKEGEQLAKLARYQYKKGQDAETRLSMEGVEADKEEDDEEITLTELTNLIFKNLRHQG